MPETDTTDQASLCELPAIGQPLMGGTFAGITTQADGTPSAAYIEAAKAVQAWIAERSETHNVKANLDPTA